jgi:hypothetical protein
MKVRLGPQSTTYLHDGNVTVERPSNKSRSQSHPVRLGETEHDARECNAGKTDQRDGFSAIDVGNGAPAHGRHGFGDSIGRHQESSIEGGLFLGDSEVLHHFKRVGEDGVEREWLREATYSCDTSVREMIAIYIIWPGAAGTRHRTDDNELEGGKGSIPWIYRF